MVCGCTFLNWEASFCWKSVASCVCMLDSKFGHVTIVAVHTVSNFCTAKFNLIFLEGNMLWCIAFKYFVYSPKKQENEKYFHVELLHFNFMNSCMKINNTFPLLNLISLKFQKRPSLGTYTSCTTPPHPNPVIAICHQWKKLIFLKNTITFTQLEIFLGVRSIKRLKERRSNCQWYQMS